MKKILYFLIAIIGSYFVCRIMNVYWMFAVLGLWLAFGFTLLKLHLADALKLQGIVLGFLAIMLGGAVMVAKNWGEFAAGIWIVICIILLMVFQKNLMQIVAFFPIVEQIQEIVEKNKKTIASRSQISKPGCMIHSCKIDPGTVVEPGASFTIIAWRNETGGSKLIHY